MPFTPLDIFEAECSAYDAHTHHYTESVQHLRAIGWPEALIEAWIAKPQPPALSTPLGFNRPQGKNINVHTWKRKG